MRLTSGFFIYILIIDAYGYFVFKLLTRVDFYANIYAYFRKGVFNYMNIKTLKNSSAIKTILAIFVIGISIIGIAIPKATSADFANTTSASYVAKICNKEQKTIYPIKSSPSDLADQFYCIKPIKVIATAYSSTPDQTDSTPFITASGEYVQDGIIANNMLPFGTKVMIPSLYGNKIFTVEDRMNSKKSNYQIDIWMDSTTSAIDFGAKTVEIQVLES